MMGDAPPLCFVDCETTGVHPDREVWEVAMIRRDPGKPDDERQFYVQVDLSHADTFGLNVGRFYDRHPLGRYLSGQGGDPENPTLSTERALSRGQAAEDVAAVGRGMTHVCDMPARHGGKHHCEVCEEMWGDEDSCPRSWGGRCGCGDERHTP